MPDEKVLTVGALELIAPHIPWRKPIPIRVTGAEKITRLCCRICVAETGLSAREVEKTGFTTEAEFERHFREAHA